MTDLILLKEEWQAIRFLADGRSFVIKIAARLLYDRVDYFMETDKQLSDFKQ